MTDLLIATAGHRATVMSAEAAALLIAPDTTVGLSGFTVSGYPTAVPLALAARIEAEHAAGQPFKLPLERHFGSDRLMAVESAWSRPSLCARPSSVRTIGSPASRVASSRRSSWLIRTFSRRPCHWRLKLKLGQFAGKCGARAMPSPRSDSPANPRTVISHRPPWAAM